MIIAMPNNWGTAEAIHTAFLKNLIKSFVEDNHPEATSPVSRLFVNQVQEAITSTNRGQLEWSIYELLELKLSLDEQGFALLIADLNAVFDYKAFSVRKIHLWDAYKLCKHSQLRICPYCNYSYSITLFKDRLGQLRPTLDHFYPKSRYPHLALSIANLVPCCHSCNSSMKGNEDFFTKKYLHPYFDSETITFKCEHSNLEIHEIIANFATLKEEIQITIDVPTHCTPTKNSVELFAIKERYEQLKTEGTRFIDAYLGVEELLSNQARSKHRGPGDGLDLGDRAIPTRLLRFDRAAYKSQLLGKMYADLHDQFYRGIEKLQENHR